VKGDSDIIVNAAYAKYTAGLANSQGDSAAIGGQPATVDFDYRGPAINVNPSGSLVSTADAIKAVFDWFNANGGTTRPTRGNPGIPGLNPNILSSLDSPSQDEVAVGVTKRLGRRGLIRGDVVYRKGSDYYGTQVDTTTGTVTGQLAGVTRTFDKQIVVNTDAVERKYWGFTLSAAYRPLDGLQLQGNWTWSRSATHSTSTWPGMPRSATWLPTSGTRSASGRSTSCRST
jgi:hypothetical protein